VGEDEVEVGNARSEEDGNDGGDDAGDGDGYGDDAEGLMLEVVDG
jgi:hypothetical protein